MPDEPQKMNIEKDNNKLKLYMFTVQGGLMQIEMAEDVKAVMAYTDNEAVNMVRKDYPAGMPIFVKKRVEVEVQRIIGIVNAQPPATTDVKVQAIEPQEVKIKTTLSPTMGKAAQDFVYGIMLISDKFVTDKRDRAALKRIIGKIKI